MDPILLLLGWLWFDGRKKNGAAAPKKPGTPTEPGKSVPIVQPALPFGPTSKYVARANQQRAKDWIPALVKAGAPAEIAERLARWIGLESSGNPLALSRIGERGLLQSTKTTALKDKLFTPREWEELQSPATTRERHAALALKQYAFHVRRAKVRIANPPPPASSDWVWYAKLDHTRPVDLKEAKPHGAALPMARDLQSRWAADPARLQRLAMANVIAFGKVEI
jgi:hypothetical protein